MASAVTRLIFGRRGSSFSLFVVRSSELTSRSPPAEKATTRQDQVAKCKRRHLRSADLPTTRCGNSVGTPRLG
jgi:1,2-phenylacetyl-CoA epoxidase PaaB subunit